MSLQTPFAAEIPAETRRLVDPLLPEESVCRLIGNEIDQIISDEEFLDLYAVEGHPAVNPVVLALVSVFQFLEKVPDRAAAEAAMMRLDWKYALRQELSWIGFHYSDLCNFRKLPEVKQLRRVLDEQFTRGDDGETTPRPPREARGDVITTL